MVLVLVPQEGGTYAEAEVVGDRREPYVRIGSNGAESIPDSRYRLFPITETLRHRGVRDNRRVPVEDRELVKSIATQTLEGLIGKAREFGEAKKVPAVAIMSHGFGPGYTVATNEVYKNAHAEVVALVENRPAEQ